MSDLLDRFKAFYADSATLDVDNAGDIYHEQMRFKNPLVELRSRAALQKHLTDQYRKAEYCRFTYLDQLEGPTAAYLKWDMQLLQPRVSKREITLRGVTHIHFGERINYHEDIYDLGMVYQRLPLLGRVTRMVNKKMGG